MLLEKPLFLSIVRLEFLRQGEIDDLNIDVELSISASLGNNIQFTFRQIANASEIKLISIRLHKLWILSCTSFGTVSKNEESSSAEDREALLDPMSVLAFFQGRRSKLFGARFQHSEQKNAN